MASAVEASMSGRHDDGDDWIETWLQDPNPAMIQAIATELQWRRDVADVRV